MDKSTGFEQKDKTIRLLDYLHAVASLNTNLIRDVSEYENVLWLSAIPHEPGCHTQAWGRDEGCEPDDWIVVQSRREPELPAVPVQCNDWVSQESLRVKNDLPVLVPHIIRQIQNPDWLEGSDQPEIIHREENLEDYPEIKREWENYVKNKWLTWSELHNKWEKVHKIYSELFSIYQSQRRLGEEYELVLGLGLLTWRTPTGQQVRRHTVVADAVLDFEVGPGKFTVRPHTEGAKLRLELDMLDVAEQPERVEEPVKDELNAADDDPWERHRIDAALQALVHTINSQGVYDETLEAKQFRVSEKPILEYAPALILRKRSVKGLTETLQRIRKQIEDGGEIPEGFADIAEVRSKGCRESDDEPNTVNDEFSGEIFFPKPSNEEQRRIVEKIRVTNGVLVQGPPGTGKSHTIANLICHLLATGQRLLITAKTPRALQVLEGLVPEELRPLCINLLGNGPEELRSLESSVGGILQKNEVWSDLWADHERVETENHVKKLREEHAQISRRLRDIRESETHTKNIPPYKGTVARIAEAMNRDRAVYGWFTDSASMDKSCPVSSQDLLIVLKELRQVSPQRRTELALVFPDKLPSPEQFANLVNNEKKAIEDEQILISGTNERIANILIKTSSEIIEVIRDALFNYYDSKRKLSVTPHSWMSDALRDVLGGNSLYWRELHRITRDLISSVEEIVATADDCSIDIPGTVNIRMLYEDVLILKDHIQNGGKLGWGIIRPKIVRDRRYILTNVRVKGLPCTTANQFSAVADILRVRIELEKAWTYWKGRNEAGEGPYALQLSVLQSLCNALHDLLSLEEKIAKCRDAIARCPGMVEPVWTDDSQVEMNMASCRISLATIKRRMANDEIHNIEEPLAVQSTCDEAHPVTGDLLIAIRDRDVEQYARCMAMVSELVNQRQRLRKIDEYLSKVRQQLPQFANSIEKTCNEHFWQERVQHIDVAWKWAQARCWIEDYMRQEDAPFLVSRAKQIEDDINHAIAKLASIHAWSFCFRRLQDSHQSHMTAWQQSMRLLGKGTGKHAPRHRRNAQVHLNGCREAVPAWIMPLNRIWDTIHPTPGMFDVVIVDEASQCGMEAIPLFYLGKKMLIVGDDKQISPEAVGCNRDAVYRLMKQYLYDYEYQSSFDIEISLFDHGKLRYGKRRITLREHFRCMPEIIRFSNDLCYNDTPLIPLRQYGPNRLPPLEHVFVNGGYREGTANRVINRIEADAIVEKIVQMTNDDRYQDKTMGVVVLQGDAQAALIEGQLLSRLGAEEMERRRLICGKPYSFQGDERDIMFLSLVAADNEKIGLLNKPADVRRFNVAASRARDMMILFHSVTRDQLGETCLRRRLLVFFEDTRPQQISGIQRSELERLAAQTNRAIVRPPAPFDSWFEVDVALELLRKKLCVYAQYAVSEKRIDLVVEGGQSRLAVECDGDHWHGVDRYEADMQRQRQLERCGWEFYRIRESMFYADKEGAMAKLWKALEKRGIILQN